MRWERSPHCYAFYLIYSSVHCNLDAFFPPITETAVAGVKSDTLITNHNGHFYVLIIFDSSSAMILSTVFLFLQLLSHFSTSPYVSFVMLSSSAHF